MIGCRTKSYHQCQIDISVKAAIQYTCHYRCRKTKNSYPSHPCFGHITFPANPLSPRPVFRHKKHMVQSNKNSIFKKGKNDRKDIRHALRSHSLLEQRKGRPCRLLCLAIHNSSPNANYFPRRPEAGYKWNSRFAVQTVL